MHLTPVKRADGPGIKMLILFLQMESVIYLVIGVTVAFLLTATLIFTVCHCLNKPPRSANNGATSKLTSEDEFDHQQRSSSQHTFNRHSYLQQSPMTEETISLDEFDHSRHVVHVHLMYTSGSMVFRVKLWIFEAFNARYFKFRAF